MANKSVSIGLNRLAGELGKRLDEYQQRKLYGELKEEEKQKFLSNQRLQMYLQERAGNLADLRLQREQQAEKDRLAQRLAHEKAQHEEEMGLKGEELKLKKLDILTRNKGQKREDFMYNYKLYQSDIGLISGQIEDELRRITPNQQRLKQLYLSLKQKESERDEYGRNVGKQLGFVVSDVTANEQMDIENRIIDRYKENIPSYLPEEVRTILARKRIIFGNESIETPITRPRLGEIIE